MPPLQPSHPNHYSVREGLAYNGLPKITGLATRTPPYYAHPMVRDLAWLVLNPPLIAPGECVCPAGGHQHGPFPYRFSVPSSRWQVQAWTALAPHLSQGSQTRATLNALGTASKAQRLGVYFETLMRYWFEHSPQYELLCQGLAIRASNSTGNSATTKRNSTLGECDYLVFDKQRQQLQHWEVAVKFYLRVDVLDDSRATAHTHWLGPNLKDQLHRKVSHLLNHQLPLSGTYEATQLIQGTLLSNRRQDLSLAARRAIRALKPASTAPNAIRRVLWLKGALYEPNDVLRHNGNTRPPLELAPQQPALPLNACLQQGTWVRESTRNNTHVPNPCLIESHSGFSCELPRLCWLGTRHAHEILAALNDKERHLSGYSASRRASSIIPPLSGDQNVTTPPTAEHRALFHPNGMMAARYFQISDDWIALASQL